MRLASLYLICAQRVKIFHFVVVSDKLAVRHGHGFPVRKEGQMEL